MLSWWEERNTTSLEGLPGLLTAHISNGTEAIGLRSRPVGEKTAYERNLYVGMMGATVQRPMGASTSGEKKSKLYRSQGYGIDKQTLVAFLLGIVVTVFYGQMRSLSANLGANLPQIDVVIVE